MIERFLTFLSLALAAALFAVYQFFSMKSSEQKKKISELEVKGAHDEAQIEVSDKSLDELVSDNNARYPKKPS